MKSVLISIKPKWCEKIASGEKTIEVRKSKPKEVPFKAHIYFTRQKFYGEILLDADKKIRYKYCRDNGDIPIAGKVIGEFICDKVYSIKNHGSGFSVADEEQSVTNEIARQSCLDYDDMVSYLGNKDGYGWHLSDLKIYDKPKDLSEFYKPCPTKEKSDCLSCDCLADNDYGGICTNNLTRPPQSWCYVEELK